MGKKKSIINHIPKEIVSTTKITHWNSDINYVYRARCLGDYWRIVGHSLVVILPRPHALRAQMVTRVTSRMLDGWLIPLRLNVCASAPWIFAPLVYGLNKWDINPAMKMCPQMVETMSALPKLHIPISRNLPIRLILSQKSPISLTSQATEKKLKRQQLES